MIRENAQMRMENAAPMTIRLLPKQQRFVFLEIEIVSHARKSLVLH